jgi:hypothetical protein
VLAAARKAIGEMKITELNTLSVQATMQRNVGNFQVSSEVEMLMELPDKYVRTDTMSGPTNAELRSGFNGDKSLQRGGQTGTMGGAMMIRIGGGGHAPAAPTLTPEQQEEMNRATVRSARHDLSRLMLGWFGMAHPAVSAQYSYYGEAESPDGKADVIDIKGSDGFAGRLFIDQQTHLPLMLTYQGPQPRVMTAGGPGGARGVQRGAMSEEERKKMEADVEKRLGEMRNQPPTMVDYSLYFSEWRQVDGVLFPHRITRSTGGTVTEEWSVGKVKLNPRIDAKRFAVEG